MNKNRKKSFVLIILTTILLLINSRYLPKYDNKETFIKESKLLARLTGVSTVNEIANSLNDFYDTLDNPRYYIENTNLFKCNETKCDSGDYENIGLLNISEYNLIGGLNSYLASNEAFFALNGAKIYNVTPTGTVESNASTKSGLRPVVYIDEEVEVTGSGKINDPYRITNKNDLIFANATLYGEPIDEFPDETDPYIVDTVTCTNGSIGYWDEEKNKIILTTVNLPTTCTVDFKDGYIVTMTANNATVETPTSKVVGRTFSTEFNITPNNEYILNKVTCSGNAQITISGNKIRISNIKEDQVCNADYRKRYLYTQILADNPTRETRTSFTNTFATSNTGKLFTTNATEDGSTVYYFAGNAKNNWVKFGEVETYTGKCTYGGNIVLKTFDDDIHTKSVCQSLKYICEVGDEYYADRDFGNIYTEEIEDGLYEDYEPCDEMGGILMSVKPMYEEFPEINDLYWRIIRTNEDGSIRLLYAGTGTNKADAYISEIKYNNTTGNTSGDYRKYVGYMFGLEGSLENNRQNHYSSTIKSELESWYSNNLLANYDKYVSKTALYCNDRSIAYSSRPYSYERFEFGSWKRVSGLNEWNGSYSKNTSNNNPSFKCGVDNQNTLYNTASDRDKFTAIKNTVTANNKTQLSYPIALITVDEVKFIGGASIGTGATSARPWYDLNGSGSSIIDKSWWTMTPANYDNGSPNMWVVDGNTAGMYSGLSTNSNSYLRPVLSLKSCVSWENGNGSPSNPYEISVDTTCALAEN